MKLLYISGSPRQDGNADYLLNVALSMTGGQLVRVCDYRIEACRACWACRKGGRCAIKDDMSETLTPMLLECEGVVFGSPVFFNNVTAQLKALIDRTWCLRGRLRNKLAGAIVVGRRYGAEGAITALNAFFLKHEMIVANRGVCGLAYGKGEVAEDLEAVEAARRLGERILELGVLLQGRSEG